MEQLFIGQVMGTSVGSEVFIKYGWRAGAALSMGWYGWQLAILLLRGPHCKQQRWFGYEGGIEPRKHVIEERRRAAEGEGVHDRKDDLEDGQRKQAEPRISSGGIRESPTDNKEGEYTDAKRG